MKKKTVILLTILYMFMLGACSTAGGGSTVATADKPITKTGEALNTAISISIYDSKDEAILSGCFDVIDKYERMLSRTDKNSEIYKLNEEGEADVSPETLELIKTGIEYSRKTNGRFTIAIEPLSALWNFSSDSPKVPSESDINETKKHLDYKDISISGNHVTLKDKDSGIDLGAIAKGYIADKVKEYLLSKGVKSALINLGGMCFWWEASPGAHNSLWGCRILSEIVTTIKRSSMHLTYPSLPPAPTNVPSLKTARHIITSLTRPAATLMITDWWQSPSFPPLLWKGTH